MIRDPSDGSVREPKKSAPGSFHASSRHEEREPVSDAALPGADTALAPLEKDRAVKLEKSRAWLAEYYARRAGCGRVAASSASSKEEPTN